MTQVSPAPAIRPLRPGDLPALARIEEASFPSAWSRSDLERWLRVPRARCLVAELSGEVAGFALAVAGRERLHVVNLAVGVPHRRRGLALRLLSALDELASGSGCARIELEVRETNLAAQLLYRKAGYAAVRILRGYYGEEDGYLMRKRMATAAAPPPR